jgi:hypothetical protein
MAEALLSPILEQVTTVVAQEVIASIHFAVI